MTVATAAGDIFRNIVVGLNGVAIADFVATDTIHVTDFAPGAGLTLGHTQQGSSGILTLSKGLASTTITLQGHLTAASFTTASDLPGGVVNGIH